MMNAANIQKTVDQARQMRESGMSDDGIIMFLHDAGLTITESMKTVMEVYGVSLRDAKAMVTGSSVWATEARAAKPFQDDCVRSLEELGEKKPEP